MLNDDMMRMLQLYREGYNCSQILMTLGLETMGKENSDLVKAIAGLGGGIGFTGKTCGALTGGACLLSLYAGKGMPDGKNDDFFSMAMIADLTDWFEETIGKAHGSINCEAIIGDDLENKVPTPACATIIGDTYNKIKEILIANGVDPTDG